MHNPTLCPIHLREEWSCPFIIFWDFQERHGAGMRMRTAPSHPEVFATGLLPGIHCLAYTDRVAQNDHTPPCMFSQESKRGKEWTPSSFCLHSRSTPCLGIPHHHRGTLLVCGQLLLHQDPKIFFAELVSNQSVPSPHCCMGFLHARCRTLLLPLINFMRFLLAHSSILWECFWMASLPPNYLLLTNLSPTDLLERTLCTVGPSVDASGYH